MKIKHVITTLALAGLLGAGAFAGIKANEAKEVKADSQTSDYYLAGNFGGVAHWDAGTTTRLWKAATGDDLGYLTGVTLTRGDQFKFKYQDAWATELNVSNLKWGTAKGLFWGDGNIYCSTTGTYDIYVNKDKEITINFATAATYSYVMSNASNNTYEELTNLHAYNSDSDQFSEAKYAPALSDYGLGGQAYNIVVGSTKYSVYRIDDRFIKSFAKFKLKKDGDVSGAGNITGELVTSNTAEQVYVDNSSTVTVGNKNSNEYKAAKFLFDLVSHRGEATYDNYVFDYSICHTSVDDATELVGRYEGFAAGVLSILNDENTTLFSYDVSGPTYGEDDEHKTYHTIPQVVNALKIIIEKDTSGDASSLIRIGDATTNVPFVVIIISSIALVSVLGVALMIKRRKEDR